MAGPHQIWQLDLDKQEVSTYAGSGVKRASMVRAMKRHSRNLSVGD
jgi:hypothetical protein